MRKAFGSRFAGRRAGARPIDARDRRRPQRAGVRHLRESRRHRALSAPHDAAIRRLAPAARDVRAIASYNAGLAAVARAGGIPPFAETRTYVTRVLGLWHRLQMQLPGNAQVPPTLIRTPAHHAVVAYARTRPRAPRDSVADFTTLDFRSMQNVALGRPEAPKSREPRGLRRWFLRAFGRHEKG